jgi:hypothetical protein
MEEVWGLGRREMVILERRGAGRRLVFCRKKLQSVNGD